MNLFQVGMIATPIFGAVGGGSAVKTSGTLTTVSAIVIGACVGIGLIALARLLVRTLAPRIKLERPPWLAPLLVVFVVPIAVPILALLLSRVLVSAGAHL
jgi:hypothetical protein